MARYSLFGAAPLSSCWILISLVLFPSRVIAQGTNSDATISCQYLYDNTTDVWLFGEAAAEIPFQAQLLATYSFLPIAQALGTQLVVGDLSVSEVSETESQDWQWKSSTRSFSRFFDLDRFTAFCQRHGLQVISQSFYESCFIATDPEKTKSERKVGETKFLHTLLPLKRIPEFLPYSPPNLDQFLYYANAERSTMNLPPVKFPFAPHQQIRIDSRMKMTAMYNFWNDSSMRDEVFVGLAPSTRNIAMEEEVRKQLPEKYSTVHVRLDDEGLRWFLEDTVDETETKGQQQQLTEKEETLLLTKIAETILQSASVKEKRFTSLYLFPNTLHREPISVVNRLVRLLQLFHQKNENIQLYVRESHFQTLPATTVKSQLADSKTFHLVSSPKDSTPEEWLYVDMLLSRQSQCFVPSLPLPSLTSYLILRWRQIDGKKEEKYEDITPQSRYGLMYTYRDWGF